MGKIILDILLKLLIMYKIIFLLLSIAFVLHAKEDNNSSIFSPNYSFSNINLNYFDWDNKSEKESGKGDFTYIGFEGGAGWEKVDLYTFLNIENPFDSYNEESPNGLRFSYLVDLDVEIKNNFKLHIQNFALNSDIVCFLDIRGIGIF